MGITIIMSSKKRWKKTGWHLNPAMRASPVYADRVAQKTLDHIEESINQTRRDKAGNAINK